MLRGDDRFRQIDVAVDNFDEYPSSEQFSLFSVDDAGDYLETVELALATVPLGWADAVVYTAGVDPHEYDSHGGLDGITDLMIRTRERILFDWTRSEGVPIAILVAGGYASFRTTDDNVARLHMMAVRRSGRNGSVFRR